MSQPEEASKAAIKAQRREKQEAQRAAKAQKQPSTSKPPQSKPVKEPKIAKDVPLTPSTPHSNAATAAQINTSLFMHLEHPGRALKPKTEREIHPCVKRLALQWSEFQIVGCNARCLSMLTAFKEVIRAYTVPPGSVLSRHLPSHLSPHIEHLYKARSRSLSLGNAIRYLKWEIAQIPLDTGDDEAKELLCERIDHFIRDRIVYAGKVIQNNTIAKIRDGDVVLTYARSSLVESILLEAKKQGKEFSVVVVDSRPMLEGAKLLKSLESQGIPTTYALISALGTVLSSVNLVLLGAHALLSDGGILSRAGTAAVAMMCKQAGKPVACCCETYKFSERIMLDSISVNEMGSTAPVLSSATRSDFELESVSRAVGAAKPATPSPNPSLAIYNLLYDVSRPEDVTVVISEAGLISSRSITAFLRDFKPLGQV